MENILKKMSIKQKVGQVCVPILQSDKITDDIRHQIEEMNVGVIRYCPDAEFDNASVVVGMPNKYFTPDQTAEFLNKLQRLSMDKSGIPLIISVDQEGSTRCDIDRAGAMVYAGHMCFGAVDDTDLTYLVAKATAEEFRAMGITQIQAPILDVLTYEGRKTMKVACFGSDPDKVTAHSLAMKKGFSDGRVISMVKHFPGYGSIEIDAHKGVAYVTKPVEDLEKVDLLPYKELFKTGVDAVMIGHVIVNGIDKQYPATISKKVIKGYLRDKLGFDGFIMTDAMRMQAIQDKYGTGLASVMAVNAGCDLILLRGDFNHFKDGYDAILEAVQKGEISEETLDNSVLRVLRAKQNLNLFENPYVDPQKAKEIVGCKKHKDILRQLASKSISVLKDEDLPLKANDDKKILVVTVEPQKIAAAMDPVQSVDMLIRAIKNIHKNTQGHITALAPTDKDIESALEKTENADIIIIGTCDAIIYSEQAQLVKALYDTGKTTIVVAMNSPFDIDEMEYIKNYVCTYGVANDWMIYAADSIFGYNKVNAVPPVKIPKL